MNVNDYILEAQLDCTIMRYVNSDAEFLPPTANGNIRESQYQTVIATESKPVYMQNKSGADIGPHKRPNP